MRPAICFLGIVILVMGSSGPNARADTFTVNTTGDAPDGTPGDGLCDLAVPKAPPTGVCTLRAAVMEANALLGADTVNLGAEIYPLGLEGADEDLAATGDLDVTDELTINGAGADTTIISGGGIDRVFHVLATGSLLVEDATIRNGSGVTSGGGILNEGSLTLTRCTINGNSAAQGGGIYVDGPIELVACTVSGNTASDGGDGGGGLFVTTGNSAMIHSSTVSGNVTAGSGGGIFAAGAVELTSSTVSANSASTNGGGIATTGTLTLKNTIVANNDPGECHIDMGGAITSQGYNLSSDDSCSLANTGDLTDTDPLLGALQDNTGPTRTHALLDASPAVDAGDPKGCPATDQRGFARPVDGNGDETPVCDIGATEYVDCNSNNTDDGADIGSGAVQDCQGNSVPDDCELTGNNCDDDGVPDDCEDDTDGDQFIDDCDNCPQDPNDPQTDTDGDQVGDVCDNCVNDPNPGQENADGDDAGDACDGCPDDPNKIAPGVCGCGVPDTDSDGDNAPDCVDGCPNDPNKTDPGICGCGVVDDPTDTDGDQIPDCNDTCVGDDALIGQDCDSPIDVDDCEDGIYECSSGTLSCTDDDDVEDADADGVFDCHDLCPDTPPWILVDPDGCPQGGPCCFPQGVCLDNVDGADCALIGGSFLGDRLTCDDDPDGDGAIGCDDGCPLDANKTDPGVCGCGVSDEPDDDVDGVPDCIDVCPDTPQGLPVGPDGCPLLGACCFEVGVCVENADPDDCVTVGGTYQGNGSACGGDMDGDGMPDICDQCPNEPALTQPSEPGTEATCTDGVDNDCDGLTDAADPDCATPSCPCGDLNGDGDVNLADFTTFAGCFGLSAPTVQCDSVELFCSDLDGDGEVNLNDFVTFAQLFGQPATGSPPNCN